jgi:phospholipid N-methyltransferase
MKTSSARIVEPELLDVLPPQDKHARRSRHDLRRLNQFMNHPRTLARALAENLKNNQGCRIAELGAGDGHFLFSVARRLQKQYPGAEAILVDRLNAFDPQLAEHFKALGWRAQLEISEVTEWLRRSTPDSSDAIISNLFLHQFRVEELHEMLLLAAHTTRLFVALEPSRSWLPRLCGHFLWTIGCNSVTRHDANISIRAGFSGRELSALWPKDNKWELTERPAGLFSHLFIARRKD